MAETMICDECKRCCNYQVSELGCYGTDKPCEHFYDDEQEDDING